MKEKVDVSDKDEQVRPIVSDPSFAFPSEYAVAGWFKWVAPQQQQPWHLTFRLTINDQKTNQNHQVLGDRDLAVWVG